MDKNLTALNDDVARNEMLLSMIKDCAAYWRVQLTKARLILQHRLHHVCDTARPLARARRSYELIKKHFLSLLTQMCTYSTTLKELYAQYSKFTTPYWVSSEINVF